MSRIAECLQKIKTAIYGREVRDAIHDSISECYDDVVNAKTIADTAAESANKAASSAETFGNAASEAANSANSAAELAQAKANLANQKATLAEEKANVAAQEATNAKNASDRADSSSIRADDAAGNATRAAEFANKEASAARGAANVATNAASSAQSAADDARKLRAPIWYSGTKITGKSTAPSVYPTGIDDARVGDRYQYKGSSDSDIGNVYLCVTAGNSDVAEWIYDFNIRGTAGSGSVSSVCGVMPEGNGDVILDAAKVKARPDDWMPTPAEVGAHPDDWMPTAEQVGARPSKWMPSASDIGAIPNGLPTTEARSETYVVTGLYTIQPPYNDSWPKITQPGWMLVLAENGLVWQFCAENSSKSYYLYGRSKGINGWDEWRGFSFGDLYYIFGQIDAIKARQPSAKAVTLTVEGWLGDSAPYSQTVTVEGMTADVSNVHAIVSPDPLSFDEWGNAQIKASEQGAGTLTYEAQKKPSEALTANVLIIKGGGGA